MKLRAALVLLRLALLGAFILGLLLGAGETMQPWLMAGATLFLATLVISLFLAWAARRSANG